MIFSGSKHPQVLSLLSHEFLSKCTFASLFPWLQTLIELCFATVYRKPTINTQLLPWFLPSIFAVLYFPDVCIFKSLVTLLSDPGGSTDHCVKSHSSNEPSNTQWCMDVPIKSASYFLNLAAFLIQGGLIVCLQLFNVSNEAGKRSDHLKMPWKSRNRCDFLFQRL